MGRFGKRTSFLLIHLLLLLAAEAQSAYSPIVKIPFPAGTLGWNADDTRFALGEDNIIIVRDAKNSEITHTLPFKNILLLSFSHEGGTDMLLALSSDGTTCIWNFDDDDDLLRNGGGYRNKQSPAYTLSVGSGTDRIVSAAFSRNSNLIAVATEDGALTAYYKLRYTQTLIPRVLDGHSAPSYSLAVSPDEKLVASASSDGTILVHNANSGEVYAKLPFYSATEVPVLFSADSLHVISCMAPGSLSVRSFDGRTVQTVQTGERVKSMALSSDGGSVVVLTSDDRLRFYSLSTAAYQGYVPSYNLTELTSFSLSASGEYVLVGHADGSIYRHSLRSVFLRPDQNPPKLLLVDSDALVREGSEHRPDGITEEMRSGTQTVRAQEPERATVRQTQETSRRVVQDAAPAIAEKYNAFDVSALVGFFPSYSNLYTLDVGADLGWRTTYLTAPLYEGVGLRAAVGFPSKDFPTQYSSLDGTEALGSPYLFLADIYLPFGIDMRIKQSAVFVFAELAPAFRMGLMMSPSVAAGKLHFSFDIRFSAGITVNFINIAVSVHYDTVWGFIPEAGVGIKFRVSQRSAA